ncbi:MAG: GGDEF domain-containing protein [Actinomycetes bacterium]
MVPVQAEAADERVPLRPEHARVVGVPADDVLSPGAVLSPAAVVAATAGLAVPAVSVALQSFWPVLALPPLVAVACWHALGYRRAVRRCLAQADAVARAGSLHDELTGCVNRTGLHLLTSYLLPDVRRRGDALHAFVVDVDQLAHVNDLLGYAAGDEVLLAVADAVRTGTRGSDVVSRGSGDEFVVVGPGTGMRPGELERRVRARLVEASPVPPPVWPGRVTAGHAVLEPWDGGGVEDLVRRAREDLLLRTAMRAPSAPEPPLDPPPAALS